jgi:hypothetical protein
LFQENIPTLTNEEQSKVLEYAYYISECVYERDKLTGYAMELRQIYRTAYMRESII